MICAQLGGLHRFLPSVQLGIGKRFVLKKDEKENDDVRIPYQLDGDPCGELPMEIEIVPRCFSLVAPSKVVRREVVAVEALEATR